MSIWPSYPDVLIILFPPVPLALYLLSGRQKNVFVSGEMAAGRSRTRMVLL